MPKLPLLLIFILSTALPYGVNSQDLIKELPAVSMVLDGYTRESVEKRIIESGPHHIEGIWQMTTDGATIVIERTDDYDPSSVDAINLYRMVILKSPNRSLRPGTVMGYISPAAKSGTYAGRIYTSQHNGSKLSSPKDFTIALSDADSRMSITRLRSKYSLNLWRMLPYMFRYSVKRNSNSNAATQGCRKIFPAPALPSEPIYL